MATPRTLSITKAMRARVILRQHGRCAACKEKFNAGDAIEMDHGHDLELDGPDIEANLFAKHRHCHKKKTSQRATDRARIRKILGTTKAKPGRPLRSRGFDKSRRKKMNGDVEKCP